MATRDPKGAVQWLDQPEEHDYPAASSYLSLLRPGPEAEALVNRLRAAPVVTFKAKDVFRASALSLLGVSNSHVERDRQKLKEGKALSPILLVRDPEHAVRA